MVVVGSSAIPGELVEFADGITVLAAIVERVEDRDSVRGQRDGSAKQWANCRLLTKESILRSRAGTAELAQAMMSVATDPATSVSRISRPA